MDPVFYPTLNPTLMILTQAPVFFSAFLCGLLPSALGLCSYACPPQVPVNGEGTQAQNHLEVTETIGSVMHCR